MGDPFHAETGWMSPAQCNEKLLMKGSRSHLLSRTGKIPCCRAALILLASSCFSFASAGTVADDVPATGRLTLQDDPIFQPANYKRNIEEDPGCDRDVLWGAFRTELMTAAPEMRVELVYQKTIEWGLENATKVDEQAKICMLGLVSLQYLFSRFLLDEAGSVEAAAHSFRLLDSQAGAIHPDLFDKASGYGQVWPVTTDQIDSLRRAILRASTGGGSGGPERRRRFKNAFGLHDGDWQDVWNAWRPDGQQSRTVGPGGFGAAKEGAPQPSFRVYVYDPDEHSALRQLSRGAAFCKQNQWGMEVALHDWFLACPCRTDNPDEADFFFVPHYTSCLINHADTFKGCDTKQVCHPTTELFEQVLQDSHHFKRKDGGADHLFVWGSGMAADGPFASWRQWVPNAVFLMTETELWNPFSDVDVPSFTPHKDILVPGRINVEDIISLRKLAKPLEERPYLGHFVGWPRPPHPSIMSKEDCKDATCELNVRSVLLAMKGREHDMHIDVDVPYAESFIGLTSSLFCFVPRGKSAWSSRFFQTYFAGCIPVILNDRYEPPFGEIVDLKLSTIKWPMTAVSDLVAYLRYLRDHKPEVVTELQSAGRDLMCWYAWPSPFVEFSWLEVNKSKLNATCSDWHIKNAYVAVTRLLSTKVTHSRQRFFYPGATAQSLERYGALG